jgi:hypothetical protein
MEENLIVRDAERLQPVGDGDCIGDGALKLRNLLVRVLIDADNERPSLGRDVHAGKNFAISSNVSG